jgi:hypothetical protein
VYTEEAPEVTLIFSSGSGKRYWKADVRPGE